MADIAVGNCTSTTLFFTLFNHIGAGRHIPTYAQRTLLAVLFCSNITFEGSQWVLENPTCHSLSLTCLISLALNLFFFSCDIYNLFNMPCNLRIYYACSPSSPYLFISFHRDKHFLSILFADVSQLLENILVHNSYSIKRDWMNK